MGEVSRQEVAVVERRAGQLDPLERPAGLAGQRIGRLRVTVVRHAGALPAQGFGETQPDGRARNARSASAGATTDA
jgi:hypothetical protein